MRVLSLPKVTVVAALLAAACSSANALTIPTNALEANSVQVFSKSALNSYKLFGISIKPLGNATAVAGTTDSFNLPVTSITVGLSGGIQIQKGDAKGSALEISRVDPETGDKKGLTVANFTIDYLKQQVLADTTPIGGTTKSQAPLYSFEMLSPLSVKYQFPLTITAKEQLGNLRIIDVEGTVDALGIDPDLGAAVIPAIDFGVINIDIGVKFRSKPVSTKPYVPAI